MFSLGIAMLSLDNHSQKRLIIDGKHACQDMLPSPHRFKDLQPDKAGRKQLTAETRQWKGLASAIGRILGAEEA